LVYQIGQGYLAEGAHAEGSKGVFLLFNLGAAKALNDFLGL
jgi:hypothetical protein